MSSTIKYYQADQDNCFSDGTVELLEILQDFCGYFWIVVVEQTK